MAKKVVEQTPTEEVVVEQPTVVETTVQETVVVKEPKVQVEATGHSTRAFRS